MENFFDRDKDRKILDDAIEKINSKKNTIIWLEGASGVGKTYLLKHSLKKITCPIFEYLGYKKIYKCEKLDMSQEFSYISMVLATLQNKNQKVFQDIVYEYFAENNYIYFLDAFVSILSNICGFKWFKNLLEKKKFYS